MTFLDWFSMFVSGGMLVAVIVGVFRIGRLYQRFESHQAAIGEVRGDVEKLGRNVSNQYAEIKDDQTRVRVELGRLDVRLDRLEKAVEAHH